MYVLKYDSTQYVIDVSLRGGGGGQLLTLLPLYRCPFRISVSGYLIILPQTVVS